MEFYIVDECNDFLLLKEVKINLEDFDMERLENGYLKLIKKNKYISIENIDSYNFRKSKINKIIINNKIYKYTNYKSILDEIYYMINNGTKIIKHTTLNIVTISKQDQGFYYYKKLGISVQGVESKRTIKEIINQCENNNIKIELYIILQDGTNVNIKV
jgi:hypothetical protein